MFICHSIVPGVFESLSEHYSKMLDVFTHDRAGRLVIDEVLTWTSGKGAPPFQWLHSEVWESIIVDGQEESCGIEIDLAVIGNCDQVILRSDADIPGNYLVAQTLTGECNWSKVGAHIIRRGLDHIDDLRRLYKKVEDEMPNLKWY